MIAVEGDGLRVTDSEGRSWIDVTGGQGAVNIGYGRTEMGDIVYEQAAALNYMPQRSAIPSTIELVRKIAEIAPGTLNRTFPVSSGAEANETAIKVARAYHKRNGESGTLQDHQQVRLLSRGLGPRAVVRLDARPPHGGLRAGLPGDAVRASAERVPVRRGRATSRRRSARCAARRQSRSSSSFTNRTRWRRSSPSR